MNRNNLPLSEKYRPRVIDDLILDKFTEIKIKNAIEKKEIENIIFTGISGVGKTSTVKCIARSIYHRNNKNMIFELNASNERGIKSVVDVENFCKQTTNIMDDYCKKKLLILDEADTITTKALKSLSSLMNKYPQTAMIFTCNDPSKIKESIQSKCTIIKFGKMPMDKYLIRLKYICDKENIHYEEEALKYLYKIYDNDVRKILNTIELIHVSENIVTIPIINEVMALPSEHDIYELIDYIIQKNKIKIVECGDNFEKKGYCSQDILLIIIKYLQTYEIDLDIKINMLKILSTQAYEMSKNDSKYIHLIAILLECIPTHC
jgi:DNA polymerase III delta prime subunit